MKLSYLRYFLVVCKHCNLSRAAEELYVSQPTLSYAINDLEQEFGVTLFHRKRNGLVLTDDGEKLKGLSTDLLEQADDLVRQMTAKNTDKSPVRLGIPPVIGSLVFPEIFSLIQKHSPDTRIEVHETGSISTLPLLQDDSLDAAIVSHSGPISSTYDSLLLGDVPIVLYISIDNPAASMESVSFSTIPSFPLVLLREDAFITQYVLKEYRKNSIEPDVILQTNNLHAIRNLLDHNVAATFLYDGSLSHAEENIVTIPLQNCSPIHISLVWNRKQNISREFTSIIKILKTYMCK